MVEKYRPQNLKDLVLSTETRGYFEKIIESGEIPHLLFCGPPGTGKTTLSKILVKELGRVYRYINASDERGIDAIRDKIIPFAQTKSIDGKLKIIILDETEGLTGDSQRALRNVMEEYSNNLRFIMTANYKNRIIAPLKSRAISFELMPPLKEVVNRIAYILTAEDIEVTKEQKPKLLNLIQQNYPDVRKIIGLVQKYTESNVLNIKDEVSNTSFAKDVLKQILKGNNLNSIREYIIQNEVDFNSDYHSLLKGLFEEVYKLDTDNSKKAQALVLIGDAMYKHQMVMDFEINAFCCIIQLQKALA